MKRFGLSSESTVITWIQKRYIPGAGLDPASGQYTIPEYARPPYTRARAQNTTAIYKSIVKACILQKGISASLYKLTDSAFEAYTSDLARNGYIEIRFYDGVPCYYSTLKSQEFLSARSPGKLIQGCIAVAAEATAKGIATAAMEQFL